MPACLFSFRAPKAHPISYPSTITLVPCCPDGTTLVSTVIIYAQVLILMCWLMDIMHWKFKICFYGTKGKNIEEWDVQQTTHIQQ